MWRTVHEILIGPPLPTQQIAEKRLDNFRALAALSPAVLASLAYANQEIFLGLAAAGAAGLAHSLDVALIIAAQLALLALSYTQTITAYPGGGGSYAVARENLGLMPGLVAAAALMIDYVLNVAVSLTAGVAALASAFPVLWEHRTLLSLILLVAITLINLRGVQESGSVMLIPVYLFAITYLALIAVGVVRALTIGPAGPTVTPPEALEPVTFLLLLRAFAAGATALTGVEAVSNAVPVFKPPEIRHANQTMVVMAALMITLFVGTVGLTQHFDVVAGPQETILSALTRRVVRSDAAHVAVQGVTLLMLVVAANTSFVGFPRLTSLLARDGYLPNQLTLLGERLVFTNGIMLLSGLAGVLIAAFRGDTHSLIPLFAVGAFLAFTLSQTGMVIHWLKVRGPGWWAKSLLNGLGALATGVALLVIAASKLIHGAWIVMILIPLLVLMFRSIQSHYAEVRAELSLSEDFILPSPPGPASGLRVVVPVAGLHRGVIEALRYARSFSHRVVALHIELEPGSGERLHEAWEHMGLDAYAALTVIRSPYRRLVQPFFEFLDSYDVASADGDLATVMVPELIPARWWHHLLHNQTAWLLKMAMLYRRRRLGFVRAIIDYPVHMLK